MNIETKDFILAAIAILGWTWGIIQFILTRRKRIQAEPCLTNLPYYNQDYSKDLAELLLHNWKVSNSRSES